MTQSPEQRRPRLGLLFPLLVTLGLLLLAAVSFAAWYQWQHNDKIYAGVSVSGIPLGGLTTDEAASAIADALSPYPGPNVTVRFGGRSWVLSSDAQGVTVDAAATAAQAYAIGREGLGNTASGSLAGLVTGLKQDTLDQWEAWRDGVNLAPLLQRDENQQAYTLERIASEVNLEPVEGILNIGDLEVRGLPGRLGREVDLDATRISLATAVRRGFGGTVDLVVHDRRPAVMSVDAAIAKARGVLGRSLVLTAETLDGPQEFSADPALVRQWLTLAPVTGADGSVDVEIAWDRERMLAYLSDIAKQLDRSAHNASIDFDVAARQVIVLEQSRPGQMADVEAAVAAMEAALQAPASLDANGVPVPQQIALPVAIVQPKVDSNRVAEMGIVGLVSEGTTSFKGSPPERVHNIVNAANKFQHVVVPPGEEFSFNRNVGAVTAANGFADALVIAGDRTAVGIGGGVCQVSTTAFRAAFWGGFPITERWAHGYVVGWYGKPGMDASIFTPSVDFRFRNDTGSFLLIKSAVNTAKGTLTFYIYGTKPNRTVEMTGPVITNVQKAPPPAYQADPTLKAGQIKQVDWAKEGLDAVVTRIIRYGDGTVHQEKIFSKYRPWRAIYLYGSGAKVPGSASTAKP